MNRNFLIVVSIQQCPGVHLHWFDSDFIGGVQTTNVRREIDKISFFIVCIFTIHISHFDKFII